MQSLASRALWPVPDGDAQRWAKSPTIKLFARECPSSCRLYIILAALTMRILEESDGRQEADDAKVGTFHNVN